MNTEKSAAVVSRSWADTALPTRVRRVLAIDPTATAIEFEGENFSWKFIADAVIDLESALSATPEAMRIGISIRNRPWLVAAVIATLATGRQIVTLSPHLGDTGLAEDIQRLQPDVIIADAEDWNRPQVVDAARSAGVLPLTSSAERAVALMEFDWTPQPAYLDAGDIAVLMMTSGTTGKPKRVELTYPKLVAAFAAAGTSLESDDTLKLRSGVAILWASLVHISGLYFAISNVLSGRATALMDKFKVDSWVELVKRHKPGYAGLPPTTMRMVINADVPAESLASLRAVGSGTAPVPPELAEEFEDKYGIPVLVTYGATEFAGAIAGWSLSDRKAFAKTKRGSVGRPHEGIELGISDPETGEDMPVGQRGILKARGPQLPGDGADWIKTTDLASLDEDGFLYIHGRTDDAINRGGFKIPPSVVEDELRRNPSVIEASCVGLPDQRLGQVPVAAVTVRDGATAEQLLDWLQSRLTRYQIPVQLKVVDELPLTPSLKVSRPSVQELFTTD